MSLLKNPAIPEGSAVLVTGVNGLIGSHTADKFLEFGYNVRGTVRDPKKHAWISELLDKRYGKGRFELVAVPDMAKEGAFDNAVKGVSAFIHVASNLTWDPDPNKVIPGVINGTLVAVRAAAKEPSVKRFVLTSSSWSVFMPIPDQEMTVDKNVWNEESVKKAWRDPPYEQSRAWDTYAASKVQGEQALWKWVEENKPDMVVNAVLPNANFGRSLDVKHQGHPSTASWIERLWTGDIDPIRKNPPQYYIDVEDSARLLVAAAIHPDVKSERIMGMAGPFQFNDMLAMLRKWYPDRKFPDDFMKGRDISTVVGRDRAEGLLKELGRPGWVTLEETVKNNLEGLAY